MYRIICYFIFKWSLDNLLIEFCKWISVMYWKKFVFHVPFPLNEKTDKKKKRFQIQADLTVYAAKNIHNHYVPHSHCQYTQLDTLWSDLLKSWAFTSVAELHGNHAWGCWFIFWQFLHLLPNPFTETEGRAVCVLLFTGLCLASVSGGGSPSGRGQWICALILGCYYRRNYLPYKFIFSYIFLCTTLKKTGSVLWMFIWMLFDSCKVTVWQQLLISHSIFPCYHFGLNFISFPLPVRKALVRNHTGQSVTQSVPGHSAYSLLQSILISRSCSDVVILISKW